MRAGLFTVLLSLVACSSSSGGSSNADAWVGNWSAGGTQSTTCGGATATTQLNGTVIISLGSASGTIDVAANSCSLTFDVSGSTGTLNSGQMCTVTTSTGNATITLTQGTATLNGSTITGTEAGSATNTCSFNQQFTLTKM